MPSQDRFVELPDDLAARAQDLTNYGLPVTLAVGRATYQMKRLDNDWTPEDVADAFGVSEATLRTYASKANDRVQNALNLTIAEFGGQNHILATAEHDYRNQTVYITQDFGYYKDDDYEAVTSGHGKGFLRVITVEAGGPSGEPAGNRTITTTTYDGLEELADEEYRNTDQGTYGNYLWRTLLIDAGINPNTLENPADRLPDDHPDRPDTPY